MYPAVEGLPLAHDGVEEPGGPAPPPPTVIACGPGCKNHFVPPGKDDLNPPAPPPPPISPCPAPPPAITR